MDGEGGKPRIGVYVCHCGVNIAGAVDVGEVRDFAEVLGGVVVSRDYQYMCSNTGQDLIREDIKNKNLTKVVVASCSPELHETTFMGVVESAGINRFQYQQANIREHCSWVTEDERGATEKAKRLVNAAVSRVRNHEPLTVEEVDVNSNVLVVGGGIAGIQAALDIAESGKQVYLVEKSPSLGGHMAQLDKTFPTLDCSACILTPKMSDVRNHPNIELFDYSEVNSVNGRIGNYEVEIKKKPRYVNTETCTSCGECTEVCPVTVPDEFNEGLDDRKAIYRPFPQAVPNTFTISRKGAPACETACPIHQNSYGYVSLVAEGKYEEALDTILRDNPLPEVLGRVCLHPCEESCGRADVDEPISICHLKRFVAEQINSYDLPKPEEERGEKIAIVGSGPAGLECAYDLRRRGYQVKVFEMLPVAGGMLATGIPEYRLPNKVLQEGIGRLEEQGVEIELEAPIGEEVSFYQLKENFDAVFIAIGAHKGRTLGIPGEKLPGVLSGIELLRDVNLGTHEIELGDKVIIVGGGNTAIDTARTANRMGVKEVVILYRRSREQMPASDEEVEETLKEGVNIKFLTNPTKVLRDEGVVKIECIGMELGEPDESGRRKPIPIEGSESTILCDNLVVAIGQTPEVSLLSDDLNLETTDWGNIVADETTLQTNIEGVFAGGDCVTGPDTVVNAMEAGKKAGESIHRFINGLDLYDDRELEGSYESEIEVDVEGEPVKERVEMPKLDVTDRKGFEEVNLGFTENQAKQEAERCLNCAICCDCRLCVTACDPDAINYSMGDEIIEKKIGTAIIATGSELFNPSSIKKYRYDKHDNVLTSLEFERMKDPTGPTDGKILLSDGNEPERVGIIHCVGSRDDNNNSYCSRVCCMYSLKFAHYVMEETDAEVYNFYIDMRAFGEGHEEFYERVLSEGANVTRGKVAEVEEMRSSEGEGRLLVRLEDTLSGYLREIPLDMVILSVAIEPVENSSELSRMFNIAQREDGFFKEKHIKLAPLETAGGGVFLAGTCQGPKDIPDSVAQASGAASKAISLADKGSVMMDPYVAEIDEDVCVGCMTCISACPYGAIEFDEVEEALRVEEALCKGCGLCSMVCRTGAATHRGFTDEQLSAEIVGVLEGG